MVLSAYPLGMTIRHNSKVAMGHSKTTLVAIIKVNPNLPETKRQVHLGPQLATTCSIMHIFDIEQRVKIQLRALVEQRMSTHNHQLPLSLETMTTGDIQGLEARPNESQLEQPVKATIEPQSLCMTQCAGR